MAFPTSPSNNQVHKEGNRSFVYDSTLGVWDRVEETDRFNRTGLLDSDEVGVIGSEVTFPSGHVVQDKLLGYSRMPASTQPHVSTGSDSFVNTGIDGSFVTVANSDDSYLVFDMCTGMTHIGAAASWGTTTMTLKASNSTTWAGGDDIIQNATPTAIYRNRYEDNNTGVYLPQFYRFIYHTGDFLYPINLPKYSAGQTLYARIYIAEPSGSTFHLIHASSNWTFKFQEIMR